MHNLMQKAAQTVPNRYWLDMLRALMGLWAAAPACFEIGAAAR
jgi:hypothetical protein